MKVLKLSFRIFLGVVLVAALGMIYYRFYSVIFSRHVVGTIESVEQIEQKSLLGGGGSAMNKIPLYSFSVAIHLKNGDIVTTLSENRQWAVAQKGNCVEATLYPVPPWDLMKGGTYFDARLDRLSDCSADGTGTVTPTEAPSMTPDPEK